MSEIRNKDRILEAIDQLRRRKARPDIDRICNFVFRKFAVDYKETLTDLQRLVEAEIVIKVEYKGNTSYRNAAKWSKYAMYKNREMRNSSGSTEIHNILSRAFASLLVEDPDYLDIGVPRTELEKFMLQDDPLTDLTEIELILTKETSSGFLVKLKNGNYSLADHPVPPSTSSNPTSPEDCNAITVQARGSQQSYTVSSSEKHVRFKTPVKERRPKLEILANAAALAAAGMTLTTTTSNITSSSAAGPSTSSAVASTSKSAAKAAAAAAAKAAAVAAAAVPGSTELGAIHVGGYRVGVRRKTAKKVFDPSDNYTPTRKRGRPVGSGACSKKEVVQSGGICCLCPSPTANTRKNATEKLIQCRDCSNRAHASCILTKSTGKEKPELDPWVCHGCRLCAFCFGTCENEAMAVCADCGESYHLSCHTPPVTEEQWNSKWTCASCNVNTRSTQRKHKGAPPAPVAPPPPPPPPVKPKPIDKNFLKFIPKEETPDASDWTVDQVCKYLEEHGCAAQAVAFRTHEIDGKTLMMLKRHDVLYEMDLKAGPALKVYHFVQLLQVKDIKKVFPFNEMLR